MSAVDATARFTELMARDEDELRLDEGALLIAAHAYPDLDVDAELAVLDRLAEDCFAPTLDALVRHLFVDLGFSGDEDDYYDPRNSYLNEVTVRRRGIPITLSVLTIEVGRRLGVPLAGVSMPGHFLLRDRVDPEVFVDPFSGGALLDRRIARRAFEALHGPDAPFDPRYLEPVGARSILARMLANLKLIFLQRNDIGSLRWVLRLRDVIPESAGTDGPALANALLSTGRFDEAATELDRLAEAEADAPVADRYRTAASGLRARLN